MNWINKLRIQGILGYVSPLEFKSLELV
ncbi:hypothetical protein [Peribacillus simplex]